MKKAVIEINQPIGSFYLTSFDAKFLVDRIIVNRRFSSETIGNDSGIQRPLSRSRVEEISHYTLDPDATFPTPIILNIDSIKCEIKIENNFIAFDENNFIAEIIDGQHRIFGLKNSNKLYDFELPVVLLFDLTEEEKAYIFSTINSNQRKVDPSLIYDLFELSTSRSPFKTAHEIARAMNSNKESPFYQRLKMLGRKVYGEETLSQGMFVNYLVDLISDDPKRDLIDEKRKVKLIDSESCPFRNYYKMEKDKVIYKILLNYFKAFANVFHQEWNDSTDYILSRSTGFGGMMFALCKIAEQGIFKKDLTQSYFEIVARRFKKYLKEKGLKLTNEDFPSNISIQRKIGRYIVECAEKIN